MLTELFTADRASAIVTSGGTTAPAAGTTETWTVASSAMFGAAQTGVSEFHVADPALPGEVIAVTSVAGTTWTVTRGAEGTVPVAHAAGFTACQVIAAAWLAWLAAAAAGGIIPPAGDLGGTPAAPQVTATHLAAPLPLSQGGTGSAAQNFFGLLKPVAVQTSNYTASPGDFVPVDATSGNKQVQLPTAPPDLSVIAVKMINTSQVNGYTVSVLPGGADVFNLAGFTSPRTLTMRNQAITLQYSTALTGWYVLDDSMALTQLKQTIGTDWINPQFYGTTGNGKLLTDAGITAAGATLTSSSANFTTGDVGKIGVIMGAGAVNGSVGIPLAFTITAWISSTQVTISAAATTTVTLATCYYGTDDQASIQAAIAACATGGTVFVPNAIYMCSAELSITKAMRLTGDGATLVFTNSAGINFGNTYISAASGGSTTIGLQIDHLIFDCSGGHVFYNINWNKALLDNLRLVQRSYDHAIFYSTSAFSNQLDLYVTNVFSRVCGAPRTVQAWYVLSAIGGGMAMCKWQNCLWQNNDGDTTQWYCEFDCTGTHNYTNLLTFDNCWFDRAFGGCIKLMSVQAATFHDCNIIDSYTQTINGGSVSWGSNSAYYIGAYSGGSNWASQKIAFIDCSRDLQGPTGSSAWDIECEATTDTVTVQNYLVRDIPGVSTFHPQFNFHGCTNVLLLGCDDAVITNSGTSQVALGGGNVSFTGALTGALEPPLPLPSDAGYLAWTFDPTMVTGGGTPGTGNLYVAAVFLRTAVTITDIVLAVTTAPAGGVTLTSGQNFAGLFDKHGTLLSGTPDQTSAWGTAGVKTAALTIPQAVGADWYFVAVLLNYSGSGTNPQIARGSATLAGTPLVANAGSSGGSRRFAQIGSYGTSLATFLTSSLTDPGMAFWAAVK